MSKAELHIHTSQCFYEDFSVLPDYDIHNQHVANQSHHTHYGVESGDDYRYNNGVGVVVEGAGHYAIRDASRLREARGVGGVGEVTTEAAAVVEHGELAPVVRVRAVACALHRLRCAEGAARFFSLRSGARLRTRCLRCPAECLSVVRSEGAVFQGRTAGNAKPHGAEECSRVRCSECADDPSRATASLHGTEGTA